VVARLGTLRLEAVQVLLPERDPPEEGELASPSGMRVAWPLLSTAHWFAECDPQLRVPVRVTLDGGPDPSMRAEAPAILRWVQEVRQDVFACDSLSLADDDHLTLRPIPFEDPNSEAVHHRVTFRGTLAEWSPDALGWLAAFLADGTSRHGVRTSLMFTADLIVTQRDRQTRSLQDSGDVQLGDGGLPGTLGVTVCRCPVLLQNVATDLTCESADSLTRRCPVGLGKTIRGAAVAVRRRCSTRG
jgi:hypothetical protein